MRGAGLAGLDSWAQPLGDWSACLVMLDEPLNERKVGWHLGLSCSMLKHGCVTARPVIWLQPCASVAARAGLPENQRANGVVPAAPLPNTGDGHCGCGHSRHHPPPACHWLPQWRHHH